MFSKAAVDKMSVGYLDNLHKAAKGYMAGGLVTRALSPANSNMRGYQSGGYVAPAPQYRGNAAVARSPEVINIVLKDHSGRMAEIAQQEIQTAAGPIVRVSVEQSTKTVRSSLPSMIADTQTRSM